MLTLKDIHKDYPAGDMKVAALRGVSISFRKSEFVSILGPSGCGKTTLLNIIGGLDQYTSGDLVIGGRSTKNFKDADWDAYRNHSIGFVFQSYNLIPHQSVLSNVELALTISGVSKAERRRRAKEALEKVGLGGELNKRPNQMSGGQMQRVAIARSLVNNPEILLADEPTGALDSETSVQIMDLLKEIAKDRLVIMVTHNPELAETYSTRIIRIIDGKIIGDTDPYEEEKREPKPEITAQTKKKKEKRLRNRSMSFGTALSLSLNNLRTKKGRTILTSFAGSIGIIGIALILAISNGVTNYINRVQEDTLSSYPITIQKETADLSSILSNLMGANASDQGGPKHDLDAVYANRVMYELLDTLANVEVQTNNLEAFKKYIESTPDFKKFASAIDYSYALDFHIYTKDKDGSIIKSDIGALMSELMGMDSTSSESMGMFASYHIWEEMLQGSNGEMINPLFYDQYDLIYGAWPKEYNEIVLVVDENNEISDVVLYSLGLKTTEEMIKDLQQSGQGNFESLPIESWSYEEICKMTFKMILHPDFYQKNTDGTYSNLSATQTGIEVLYNSDKPIELKVSGIIRPNDDTVASMLTGSIGYTTALTEYAIHHAAQSDIVKDQLADPDKDIFTGLPFKTDDKEFSDAEKAALIKEYFATLSADEKAKIYVAIKSRISPEMLEMLTNAELAKYTEEELKALAIQAYAHQMGITDTTQIEEYINKLSKEEWMSAIKDGISKGIAAQYEATVRQQLENQPAEVLAGLLDNENFTEKEYAEFFELYMPPTHSNSTYEKNLSKLGYVDLDSPTAINIYTATFADKDEISALIAKYNSQASEDDEINYTDLVALLMSSITLVINAISYVLIAFVSVSLVVSSIMIGIITYISVLERTKEIGILRAIGASKKDISRIFNAETAIVGFTAGMMGIGVTLILILIANPILHAVTGIGILSASLPVVGAVILVLLSVGLTLIAGLVPSRLAAKKDPVVALRTE
ncbi:MAG: ABC transporter ATP-binding protein/permease [Clostridia bacterium]|nr:ABC transporter ATP-binding protein/permease [Clostridia bacterium]